MVIVVVYIAVQYVAKLDVFFFDPLTHIDVVCGADQEEESEPERRLIKPLTF